LDPNTRVEPVAVSRFELLLGRKFAEVSLSDSRINANKGNTIPPSSISTETQREQVCSLLGKSQSEQNCSNVLTPFQYLQRNSPVNKEPRLGSDGLSQGIASCVRPGSYQPDQDIYSSQQNNSSSHNIVTGRRESNESSHPSSREGPTLLARKLADDSLSESQIDANSSNQVWLASASPGIQTEPDHSRLHSSQKEHAATDLVLTW